MDSIYLLAKHYSENEAVCSLTGKCSAVLASQYAAVWGVPISVPGILYYTLIFALSLLLLRTRNVLFLKGIVWISGVGFLASLGLVSIQLFVLEAICEYCMLSAVTTTLIFGFSIAFLRKELTGAESDVH